MIDVARGDDGVWVVTLNRPDKANSLTADMLTGVTDIARDAAADGGLRSFVITGAGDKVFSAGADLEAAKAGLATSPLWEDASGAIAALPCLSIAALNGTLAGGAFGMALACDLRVAVEGARFFYPVAKLGFLPQPSDPGRLVALMGPSRAKLLLMGGQKWTTDEALTFGLIDRIVPEGTALDAAREISAAAIAGKPEALQRIKQMCAG
jgi:enoyl-CoA hydratase/carnithine racemase